MMRTRNLFRPMARLLTMLCLGTLLMAGEPVVGSLVEMPVESTEASAAPIQMDQAKTRPKPDPDTPKNKKSSTSKPTTKSNNSSSSRSSTKSTAKPVEKPVSKPISKPKSKPASKPVVRPTTNTRTAPKSTTSTSTRKSRVTRDSSPKRTTTPSIARPKPEPVREDTSPSVRERQPDPPPSRPRQPREPIVEDPDTGYQRDVNPDDNEVPDIYFRTGTDNGRRHPLDDLYDLRDYDCTLVVNSDPQGADAYLDDLYLGRTPLTRTGLDAGTATLRLELEGYRTIERFVSLTRGRPNRVSFVLEPVSGTYGILGVNSDPQGANLYVNGELKGTTPYAELLVRPGLVRLTLSKKGHLDVERDIEIEAGQRKSIEVYLPLADRPTIPATLRVTSNPPDAEIYLNGTLLGKSPLTRVGIDPGKAVVFARKEGYANARQSLPLGSGEDRSINFDLTPLTGSLHIRTNPTNAAVYVDERKVGSSGGSGVTVDNVAIGTHMVTAKKAGHLNAVAQVTVSVGETNELTLTLPEVADEPYDPALYGQLYVDTFPDGLEIFLNYTSTGRYSPALFTGLQPGRYLVSTYLDGYGWDEKYVLVRAASRASVTLTLSMRPYTGGVAFPHNGYRDPLNPHGGYGVYGGYGAYDPSYPRGRVGSSDPWNEVDRYLVDWDHSFDEGGAEVISDVLVLDDGSLMMVGYRDEMGARDGLLLKVDPFGEKEWSRTYDARGFDAFTAIAPTEDFGFILAGATSPDTLSEADGWLLLCDREGEVIWSRTYGGSRWDGASAVIQGEDKSFYFAGETWSEGSGLSDGWLVKTAPDGFVQWSKRFGGKGEDRFAAMALDEEGNIILVGSSRDVYTERSDGWLIRTSPSGKKRSSETFGGNFDDGFSSLALTNDGGLVMAGYTDSEGMLERNAWLVRLNSKGVESWSRTFGGYDAGIAWDVKVQRYGYILCGTTKPPEDSFNQTEHAWIIRTDFRGEATWYRDFSDTGSTSLRSIGMLTRGEFVAVGDIERPNQPSDAWAMMLTPEEPPPSEDDVLVTPTGLMLRLVGHMIFR